MQACSKGNTIKKLININWRNKKEQTKIQYEVAKGYLTLNVVNTDNNETHKTSDKGPKNVALMRIELHQNVFC